MRIRDLIFTWNYKIHGTDRENRGWAMHTLVVQSLILAGGVSLCFGAILERSLGLQGLSVAMPALIGASLSVVPLVYYLFRDCKVVDASDSSTLAGVAYMFTCVVLGLGGFYLALLIWEPMRPGLNGKNQALMQKTARKWSGFEVAQTGRVAEVESLK